MEDSEIGSDILNGYTFGGSKRKKTLSMFLERLALVFRAFRLLFKKGEKGLFYSSLKLSEASKPTTIHITKIEILKPHIMNITFTEKDKKYYLVVTEREGKFVDILKKNNNKAALIQPTKLHYLTVRHRLHEKIAYNF